MYLARDGLHLDSYLQTLDKPTVSLCAAISGVAWMAILLNVLSLLLLGLELRDLHVVTLLRAGKRWFARSGRTTFSSPTNLTSARLCRTSTSAQSSGSGTGLCCLIKITLRNHEHENLDLLHTMTTLDCPWTYELPSVSARGTSYPWANRGVTSSW